MSKPYPKAALSIYRQILRVHRQKLPPPMREMGDSYLRDEMRRHKEAQTTPQQWKTFTAEWQKYLNMILGQADLPNTSGDISADVLDSMTPEQKQQFLDLKEETSKLGVALGVDKPSESDS